MRAGLPLLSAHRHGFSVGLTEILHEEDDSVVGLDFGIRRMELGEVLDETAEKESFWLLLQGQVSLSFASETHTLERESLFDQLPSAVSLPSGQAVSVVASRETEWAVIGAQNARSFAPRVLRPADVQDEDRGRGLAQGACRRSVRLVLDQAICPESNLVVGEVVNYPGRWSSYPPHHHDQPEIYHYRFTEPQGYGHAELGDEVFKVKSFDTLKIRGGMDHAQVSAPGYGMYYIWVVRHLPGNPYRGFQYTEEHTWLLDPVHQGWRPAP